MCSVILKTGMMTVRLLMNERFILADHSDLSHSSCSSHDPEDHDCQTKNAKHLMPRIRFSFTLNFDLSFVLDFDRLKTAGSFWSVSASFEVDMLLHRSVPAKKCPPNRLAKEPLKGLEACSESCLQNPAACSISQLTKCCSLIVKAAHCLQQPVRDQQNVYALLPDRSNRQIRSPGMPVLPSLYYISKYYISNRKDTFTVRNRESLQAKQLLSAIFNPSRIYFMTFSVI